MNIRKLNVQRRTLQTSNLPLAGHQDNRSFRNEAAIFLCPFFAAGGAFSLRQEGLETDGAFILFQAENCPRIHTECYFCPGKTFFLRRKFHCGRKYPQNTPYSRRKYLRKEKHPQNAPSSRTKILCSGKCPGMHCFSRRKFIRDGKTPLIPAQKPQHMPPPEKTWQQRKCLSLYLRRK